MTFFLRLSAALPTPAFRARPSFLRFSLRSWLFPPAPIHAAPNLNPIFHITSRKSYSAGARRGRKQRATHGSRTKERRNIFIFSLLPSFLFLVFLLSLLPRAVRSKTISEHIARVRLRSLPSNPGAFPAPSPCTPRAPPLCRPAYSTLVEDVITRVPLPVPIVSPCFRPLPFLHCRCSLFDTQEISWEKSHRATRQIGHYDKISDRLIQLF